MSGERPFLPYGRQSIDADDLAAVAEALRGDFLTTGPTVAKFEAAFAAAVGARHAVVSNSGTAALHRTIVHCAWNIRRRDYNSAARVEFCDVRAHGRPRPGSAPSVEAAAGLRG